MTRRLPLAIFLFVASVACGSSPNDSEDGPDAGASVLINTEWGFQLTRPDTNWTFTAVVHQGVYEQNGLRQTEVWMTRRPLVAQSSFQPTLFVKPSALVEGTNLPALIADIDSSLSRAFSGYTLLDSTASVATSDSTAEWQFELAAEAADNFLPGNRFIARTVLRRGVGYLLLGNGRPGEYPLDDYRRTFASLSFLR